ncbi:hypothetical protein HanXRQr2_Chr14g0660401 [Helianthus annuus]|uniref:Uncharacterized protein n=1 Tax=Helianthus annuus TaxID=4232 RepID=A0A9K3EC58_HELAN|nr:hypothetical protein HanXRQr2_Chr14g0660401 [Helianthus annuus]KAJ0487010.1 hypothetical protein HanHA89_Chr14g0585781 [Helianthus annuus]
MIIFETVSCAAIEKMLSEDKQDAVEVGSFNNFRSAAIMQRGIKYTIFFKCYVMLFKCLNQFSYEYIEKPVQRTGIELVFIG